MTYYTTYVSRISSGLSAMEVTDLSGKSLEQEQGLELWRKWTCEWREHRRSLYFVGNGASATMASHMAADATKNGHLRAKALNDPALLTAIGNDVSYTESFALQLERFADPGDALITISSSGNSPNIVAAIEAGRKLGMRIVTLSGMKAENRSRKMGDLNFYVPADRYGLVESSHQVLLHCWLDCYLNSIGIDI